MAFLRIVVGNKTDAAATYTWVLLHHALHDVIELLGPVKGLLNERHRVDSSNSDIGQSTLDLFLDFVHILVAEDLYACHNRNPSCIEDCY